MKQLKSQVARLVMFGTSRLRLELEETGDTWHLAGSTMDPQVGGFVAWS